MKDNNGNTKIFWIIFIALIILHSIPIWVGTYLPIQDIPNHITIVKILREFHNPAFNFQDNFDWNLNLFPYQLYYLICYLLSFIFNVFTANKLFLNLYIILFPLSLLYLLSAIDESKRWLSLLSFPLIYNDYFLFGFTNHLISIPLILFGLGLAISLLNNRDIKKQSDSIAIENAKIKISQSRAYQHFILLFITNILLYLSHPLGYGLFYIFLIPILIKFKSRRRELILTVLAISFTIILFIIWIKVKPKAGNPILIKDWESLKKASLWFSIGKNVDYLIHFPFITINSKYIISKMLYSAGLISLIVLGIIRLIKQYRQNPRLHLIKSLIKNPFFWNLIISIFFFFLLPFGYKIIIWFNLRIAIFIYIFLIILLNPSFIKNKLSIIILLITSVLFTYNFSQTTLSFNKQLKPFEELITKMEPNKKVLPLIANRQGDTFNIYHNTAEVLNIYFAPNIHLISYYNFYKGGISPYITFNPLHTHFPIIYKDINWILNFPIGSEYKLKQSFQKNKNGDFDYIIIKAVEEIPLDKISNRYALEEKIDDWYLYIKKNQL